MQNKTRGPTSIFQVPPFKRGVLCLGTYMFTLGGPIFCAQHTFESWTVPTWFFRILFRAFCSLCSFPYWKFFVCPKFEYFIFEIWHENNLTQTPKFQIFQKRMTFSDCDLEQTRVWISPKITHSRERGTKNAENDFWILKFWFDKKYQILKSQLFRNFRKLQIFLKFFLCAPR